MLRAETRSGSLKRKSVCFLLLVVICSECVHHCVESGATAVLQQINREATRLLSIKKLICLLFSRTIKSGKVNTAAYQTRPDVVDTRLYLCNAFIL